MKEIDSEKDTEIKLRIMTFVIKQMKSTVN